MIKATTDLEWLPQFEIHPTCGLATTEKIIGQFDEPRYFYDPQRMSASILWFGRGYVEYTLPNYLLSSQRMAEIEIPLNPHGYLSWQLYISPISLLYRGPFALEKEKTTVFPIWKRSG
jgi:predicted transcriptional regulator